MAGYVEVARPIAEVFDRAVDEPSWNPAMTSATWLTPPPVGVGTRYEAVMGGRWRTSVEFTEYDRPRRLGSRTSSSWMTTHGALTFSEEAGVTRLSWDWHYQLHGPARLLSPVFGVIGRRWERKNWERFRDLLQQRG